jgi:hypothetical protein
MSEKFFQQLRDGVDEETALRELLEERACDRASANRAAKSFNTVQRRNAEKKAPLLLATGAIQLTERTPEEVLATRRAIVEPTLTGHRERIAREAAELDRYRGEVRALCTPDEYETFVTAEEGARMPLWAYWTLIRDKLKRRTEPLPERGHAVIAAISGWAAPDHPTHHELFDLFATIGEPFETTSALLAVVHKLEYLGHIRIAAARACTVSGKWCATWKVGVCSNVNV